MTVLGNLFKAKRVFSPMREHTLSKYGCSLGKKGVTGSSICSEIGAFKNNYKASQQQKKNARSSYNFLCCQRISIYLALDRARF